METKKLKNWEKKENAILKSKEILEKVNDFLENHEYGELVFRIASGDVFMVERRTHKKWGSVPRKYREYSTFRDKNLNIVSKS